MSARELHIVVTFPTTTSALAMQKAARSTDLEGRLAPVPRKLSAGCGFAWCEPKKNAAALKGLIAKEGITTEAIVELEL